MSRVIKKKAPSGKFRQGQLLSRKGEDKRKRANGVPVQRFPVFRQFLRSCRWIHTFRIGKMLSFGSMPGQSDPIRDTCWVTIVENLSYGADWRHFWHKGTPKGQRSGHDRPHGCNCGENAGKPGRMPGITNLAESNYIRLTNMKRFAALWTQRRIKIPQNASESFNCENREFRCLMIATRPSP